ncbi:hypothetical protein CR513_38429, partial [Mucuna pruriens]
MTLRCGNLGVDIPNNAQNWSREVEKIFLAMEYTDAQKVIFSISILVEEAEYWWENTRTCMEVEE